MKDVKSLFLSVRSLKNAMGGGMKLLVSFVCLFAAMAAYAQDTTVTGTVVDDTGEPIIGATVMVEGTSNGTVTDLDGNFSLKMKPGSKIKVSYIGYDPQVVTAKNGMTITLKTNSVVLGGVEVVAYGVQKKVTVTGAISSVKGEELTRTPVASVGNVLAGQLTGVTTVQTSGEPGADQATIYVRGKGTFNGESPLIQVDGVERSMNDIDPEDIESITVLKDASATAVFGVRGANGVVLITTKRGKEGQAKIDVSTSFSIVKPVKPIEQANSYEYATFYNQMQFNDYEGDPANFVPMFSPEVVQKFKDGSDPIRFPSIEWADYTMKKHTLQTKSNINISGGTKEVRYFVSAGLTTQEGGFKNFGYSETAGYDYTRFNYRANLDIDVTPTTAITLGVSGIVANIEKPISNEGTSAYFRALYQAVPFSTAGIIDGKPIFTTTETGADGLALPVTGGSGFTYILGSSGNTSGGYYDNTNTLQADVQLNQKLDFITKGLSFRVKGAYNSWFGARKTYTRERATYTPIFTLDGETKLRKSGQDGLLYISESQNGRGRDWYAEAAFNYNRTFGLHSVGALVLYNQSKTYYPKTFSDIPQGYVGLVGRITYDYDNRYMAEFNIGYNGSENFHPDRRFGTFPAGSIGWIISNEKFFQPITKVVDFLKFRASLGLVGNDKVGGNRFMYTADPFVQNTAIAARSGYSYNFGINTRDAVHGWIESTKNNPNVGWEKALKQDYGVDIYVLNSRLRANFDYYREHRTNILLQDWTAPSYIGYTVPYANLGVVDSWGWEISLQWNDQINKDWRYWVNVNLSHNQNEVKEKKETPYTNEFQYERGHRIGARYQYQFFRFYDEETPALYEKKFGQPYPEQLMDLKNGDAVYVDLDGDGKITPDDRTRALGYTDDPQYVAGLNFGVVWKGLELSMQWTGAWDVSRMIEDVFREPFKSRTGNTDGGLLRYNVYNSWNAENPGQNYDFPRPSWASYSNNYQQASTLYEKDAKYLRLKTAQLSYTIDAPFVKKIGLRNAIVALSGYNLLTFSPYKWGDPESVGSATPQYPVQKTYTVSLKLNF
ncbi:MAG: TonB-dependent receptor [Muribaculum sp.]|nr:TonB-dependent receptor [Muribaculaceae bacterium]MCM1081261.1 TonB-dependent receptor [Muribaculum sp.]